MIQRAAFVGGLIIALAAAMPSASANELTEKDVWRSALATHPKAAELRSKIEESRGKRLSAEGGFDPKVSAAGELVPSGFYDYLTTGVRLDVPLAVWGIDLFAGYRYTNGEDVSRSLDATSGLSEAGRPVPIYKGELETLSGGEVNAGIKVPLLADRAIDSRRTKRATTQLALEESEFLLQGEWLALARDASLAFWKWVGAARKVEIEQALLVLAETRAAQLTQRIQTGALPEIVRVDNERLLLDRRQRLIQAERDLQAAAAKLSTYLRTDEGVPITPAVDRVPEPNTSPPAAPGSGPARRPEMRALELRREQARAERRLADNQVLPSLDVSAKVARDFGDGSSTLEGTDVALGVSFKLPINRFKARGERDAATARLAQIDAQARGLRDRFAAEAAAERAAFDAAVAGAQLAAERARLALTLAQAERDRFEVGASDLLLVNLRELAAAKDAKDAIDADIAQYEALARLRFALGIDPLDSQQ